MPSSRNRIDIDVGFRADTTGLQKVRTALQQLQNIKTGDYSGNIEDLKQVQKLAKQVESALTKAFNTNLNTVNIDKFYQSLNLADKSVKGLYNQFAKLGTQGKAAFNKVQSSLLTTNTQLTQSKTMLQQMGQTMMNTVRWGIASRVFNNITQSVRQAFTYVKSLDSALNDIRIVTGASADEMGRFANQANRAAQELGRSTMDYTKAALTFYQQGLNDEDVQARTQATLKAQNITGAGQQMADYLTAVWNGYKVANEEAELYVDKLAAVADHSASNMSQLAIAMSKVASSANALNVPVDSLNAQIATIVATTRQAPEAVGNALKTIYARINDIAIGAEDAQTSLGNYSSQMAKLGFSVLDANGNLRDTGDVIEQIGGQWANLSREQQIFLARTMAGQRQYNNLIALFDNWSKYTDLVTISMQSQGATAQKNAIYLDSLAAHTEKLGAAQERLKSSLVDSKSYKGLIDFATLGVKGIANFIQSIGGGGTAILALGGIVTQVFGGTIAQAIGQSIIKARENKQVFDQMYQKELLVQQERMQASSVYNTTDNQSYKQYIDNLAQIHQYWSVLSQDERKAQQDRATRIMQLEDEKAVLQQSTKEAQEFANAINLTGRNVDLAKGEGPVERTLAAARQLKRQLPGLSQAYENFNNLVGTVKTNQLKDGTLKVLGSSNKATLEATKANWENWKTGVNQLEEHTTTVFKKMSQQIPEEIQLIFAKAREEGIVPTEEQLEKLGSVIDQTSNQTKSKIDNLFNFDSAKGRINELSNEIPKVTKELDRVNENSKVVFDTNQVVQFTGGISRLASSLTSTINIFKIWGNESLSVGEKLLQTFTNVAFTLPMMLSSFTSLKDTFPAVLDKIKNVNADLIKQKIMGVAYTKAQAETKKIDLAIETAIEGIKEKRTGSQAVLLGLEEAHNKALEKQAALQKTALIRYAAIAAAVVAIVAIVAAIKAANDAWNEDAEAAKRAAQASKQAKDAYNDVKSAYEQLKNSFDSYKSAEKAIEDLTVGTEEWRNAVQDLNQQVMDLLQKYPKLASYITNTNGQLSISNQGQQMLLEQQRRQMQISQTASIIASQKSRQANITSQATNLGRANTYEVFVDDGSVATIAASSQQVQSIVKELISLEKDVSINQKDYASKIAENIGVSERQVEAILADVQSVQSLKQAIIENTNAIQAENKILASQQLQNYDFYKNADEQTKTALQTVAGGTLGMMTDNLQKNWKDYLSQYALKNYDAEDMGEAGQTILKAVSQSMGKNLAWASNQVQGSGDDRTFHFIDQSTGQELDGLTTQLVASMVAASQAMQQFGIAADTSREFLENIAKQGTQGNIISDYVSGQGFGNFTEKQLQITQTAINDAIEEFKAAETDQAKKIATENLANIFGGPQALRALAQQAGISAGEYIKRFVSDIQIAGHRFDDIVSKASPKVAEQIENLDLSGLTLGTKQAILNTLQQAYNQGGKAGLDTLTKFYEQIDDFDALEDLSNEINWSTITADGLRDALSRMGVETNLSEEYLWAFIDAQRALRGVELPSPEQNAQLIQGILGNLKPGDTVSPQDWTKLVDAGYEDLLRDFFTYTETGAMELKEDAEGFQAVVKDITLQPFIDQAEQLQARQQALQNWNQNYEDVSKSNITTTYFGSEAGAMAGQKIEIVDQEQARNQVAFLLSTKENLSLSQEQLRTIQQANNARTITRGLADDLTKILQQHHISEQQLQQDIRNNTQAQQHLNKVAEQFSLDSDVNTDQFENLWKYLQKINPAFKDNQVAAKAAAQQMLRYAHAIKQITDNYDDLKSQLQKFEAGQLSNIDTANLSSQLENVYQDAFNVDVLPQNFNVLDLNNLNALKDASSGNASALLYLADCADLSRESLMSFATSAGITEQALREAQLEAVKPFLIQAGISDQRFMADLIDLQNVLSTVPDLQIGAQFNEGPIIDALNHVISTLGLTGQAAQDYLSALGWDVEFTTTKKKLTHTNQYIDWHPSLASSRLQRPQLAMGAGNDLIEVSPQVKTVNTYESIDIPMVKVKNAKWKGSSGGNYTSTSSTSSSNGGGGGGGGGAKTASKQTITPSKTAKDIIKNVPDRDRNPYQNIQRSLQNQNDLISQLNDQQERLTGKQRLDNLQAQNQAIKEQINLEQQRLSISAKNVKGSTYNTLMQLKSNTLLKDLLNGQSGKRFIQSHYQQDAYGNNITDANGNQIKFWDITNPVAIRDAAQKARTNIYNEAKAALEDAESTYLSAVKAWNEKDAEYQNSDQGKKAKQNIEKAWETAQDTYNKTIGQADTDFDNAMSLLDQFFSQVQDDAESVKNIIEAQREQWQIALSDLQLKIQANINIGQLERDYLELEEKILKHSDKNYDSRLKKLRTYYQSRELQAATTSINQMQRALEVARKKNQGKNLTEAEKGILEKWGDDEAKIQQIISNNMQTIASGLTEIYDIVQDIHQSYLDAAKQYIDSLDKYADGYQRILDVIDNTSSIAEILYGENPTIRSGFYVKQLYYNREYLKKLQENYKLAQQNMNDESLDEETRKEWRNKFYDFGTQLQQQMSTSLQFAVDQFENNLERAVQNVSKNLKINLDSADLQWDAQQKIDDRFLDDVNSKYAQDSIARLYQNAVDAAAGDVSQQQRLKSVMQQQLKILKDKDKLTQYDVDRAKKVLQLEKARMALEDARNNKTKMRLRRDSQGNYRYEYVADELAVNDLEQKVADLENDLYNFDKDQFEKNLKDLRDVYEDYLNQRAELEKQLRQAATEDERKAVEDRIKTLEKYYGDYYNWLNEHNREYVQTNLKDSAGNSSLPYAAAQDNAYKQMADIIAGKNGLIEATKSISTDFSAALNTYNSQLQEIAQTLGLAKDAFTNGYQGINKDELNSLPFFRDAKEYLKDMSTQIEEAKTAMDDAAELDIEANDHLETISSSINSWREAYQKGFDINLQINRQAASEDIANKPLEKYTGMGKPAEFATGGMTPAWGNEGKIAILHEKELILNEQDTANMLQAFMIARELARGIMNGVPEGADLQNLEIAPLIEEINTNIQSILATLNRTAQEALKDAAALALQGDALSAAANLQAVSYSLDEKMTSLQNALLDFDRKQYEQNLSAIDAAMKAYQSQASSTLDQQVHIEASFPNVTQHQEIENAFNNLINMASMYASKTQSGLASRIPASPFNIS